MTQENLATTSAHMPVRTNKHTEQTPPMVAPLDPHHWNEGHNCDQPTPGPHNNNKHYKKRANINIAILNINGATAPSNNINLIEKWASINQTMRKDKIVILTLQETHLDEEHANDIHSCFQKSFHLYYSSDPENPRFSAGIAFLINKALIALEHISVRAIIPGRAAILTIA